MLTLMDAYSGSYSLLFVCFCEVTAIAWVYGKRRHSCLKKKKKIAFFLSAYINFNESSGVDNTCSSLEETK